jgi:hypothetical protein
MSTIPLPTLPVPIQGQPSQNQGSAGQTTPAQLAQLAQLQQFQAAREQQMGGGAAATLGPSSGGNMGVQAAQQYAQAQAQQQQQQQQQHVQSQSQGGNGHNGNVNSNGGNVNVNGQQGTDLMSTLWSTIVELSEQLNKNRMVAVQLFNEAADLKEQSVHSQTGFVLRRFNEDRTQGEYLDAYLFIFVISFTFYRVSTDIDWTEEYDRELEKMNIAMKEENMSLLHDNKQLSGLIKEYEAMLDMVMSGFRRRAVRPFKSSSILAPISHFIIPYF